MNLIPHHHRDDVSGLLVEWMAGPEARLGKSSEVFVDNRPAGAVDTRIVLTPGEHSVRVQHGLFGSRQLDCDFRPDRMVVLDYSEREWGRVLFVGLIIGGFAGYSSSYRLVQPPSNLEWAALAAAWAIAVAVAIAVATWYARRHFGVLTPYTPAMDERHLLENVTAERSTAPGVLQTGRLFVNLIVAPVVSSVAVIQPPRPRVIIDGKNSGNVTRVYRVSAGPHQVRLAGWFDRSEEITVQVRAGELTQVDTVPTAAGSVAIVAMCAAAIAAFGVIFICEFPDWSVLFFFSTVATAGVFIVLLSRLIPTIELRYKPRSTRG